MKIKIFFQFWKNNLNIMEKKKLATDLKVHETPDLSDNFHIHLIWIYISLFVSLFVNRKNF